MLGPFFLRLVVEVDWTSDVTPPRLGVVLLLLFFSLSRAEKINEMKSGITKFVFQSLILARDNWQPNLDRQEASVSVQTQTMSVPAFGFSPGLYPSPLPSYPVSSNTFLERCPAPPSLPPNLTPFSLGFPPPMRSSKFFFLGIQQRMRQQLVLAVQALCGHDSLSTNCILSRFFFTAT